MIKNVIILEDSSKAKFGGGQKVTLEVMKILKDTHSLVLSDCDKPSIFQEKSKSLIEDKVLLRCNGKVVGGKKASFSLGYLEILLFPFLYIKNLFFIIKYLTSKKYTKTNSSIYATTKKNLLLAYSIKKFLGIKYIYHAHAYDDRSSFFYKIINIALKEADKIICVSNLIKNNINLSQCQTIYNPIEIIEVKSKDISKKEKIIVATFSTLIKLKGIDYFMKSFEYLQNKEQVEYWIFGDGSEKEYLKQFENEHVKLKGFANNSEDLMLNDIDIVVVSSITEEACPMVPLEAFKCGIPVISTNIGGQAEIVIDKEVGYQIEIKNSKEIANKIDYLIENSAEYFNMSKNAIQYSKNFDIEIYRKEITKLFGEIYDN